MDSRKCSSLVKMETGHELLRSVRLAYVCSCFKDNTPDSSKRSMFEKLQDALMKKLSKHLTVDGLRSMPIVRAFRDYYWRIGIDPTKTRPAGEALARRLLQARPFGSINPIVDAGNLASAETMIPIGIYDLSKIEGTLILTVSKGGERFYPIGGKEKVLGRGIPILVDDAGKVLHIFPHRDSLLTSVREDTRCIVAIAAGVPEVGVDDLVKALSLFKNYSQELGLEITSWEGPYVVP